MPDIINKLGESIRFPFEILGKLLDYILRYFLEIGIVIGAIFITYFLFKIGVVKRLVNYWIDLDDEREKKKIKNGLH